MNIQASNDFGYIEMVLSTPGMRRLCSGGLAISANAKALIRDPANHYFIASKKGQRMGFVAFHELLEDGAAEIHVALKTRGKDTLESITKAIKKAKDHGLKTVYAVFPIDRKSLVRLCDELHFEHERVLNHEGLLFSVRQLKLN